MCGLGGEFRFDWRPADAEAVRRLSPCPAPRGPDAHGTWSDGAGTAFVHHRLRIIDLSESGAQPMVDDELGLAMVFNGCIYNHHALRQELSRAGYRFRSQSDTEVILKAFHHWG